MIASLSRTLSTAFDDLRAEATTAANDARGDAERIVREFPYALLGSLSVSLQRSQTVVQGLASGPSLLLERLRETPKELRETYWKRAEAGHETLERVRGRKGVRRASKSARTAKSAARGATTAARRAAKATTRAVSDAADALDPVDTRPYEERSVEELYELASQREIDGRSQMNKKQLIEALREQRS